MDKSMDKLRVHFEVTYDSYLEWWSFKGNAYINDSIFLPNHYFNIWDIERTYLKSCAYDLFTCSCGDEGCAGIWETPKVKVTEKSVKWWIFYPHSYKFEFDKAQYIDAIQSLKEKMLRFYTKKQWKNVKYLVTWNVAEMPFLKETK